MSETDNVTNMNLAKWLNNLSCDISHMFSHFFHNLEGKFNEKYGLEQNSLVAQLFSMANHLKR